MQVHLRLCVRYWIMQRRGGGEGCNGVCGLDTDLTPKFIKSRDLDTFSIGCYCVCLSAYFRPRIDGCGLRLHGLVR